MRQKLAQILLTSNNSQSALLALSQMIGETFLADCCAIALNPDGASDQSVWWTPQSQATFHRYQPTLLIVLQKRLFKVFEETSEETSDYSHPIALTDIQTAFLNSQATSEFQTEPQSHPSSIHIPEFKPLLLNVSTPGIKAVLAKRTHFQGRTNGVIMVMRSQSHQWTQEEIQLLETVSDQVAIAISQNQLERQVQQQIRYQAFIDQLTRAIRSAWDLPQVFQLVTEGLTTALQISRSSVLLVKYSDHPLKNRTLQIPKAKVTVVCESPRACDLLNPATDPNFEETIHSETGTWFNTSFALSDCRLCQQAFVKGTEPVVISTATDALSASSSTDPIALTQSIAPIFDLEAMPALILMPLESQGTVLGYLALQHSQPCSWQREDIIFAKLVAAQLSTAIIQSRTLRQVQALVEERTAQLKRSLEVQAKLYEKTRQQVEQLRRLHQIREEFLSTVSHELRTPLTSMTLAIRMLRQADLPPERQAKYLDILEQQCAQETSLINDLLALQKLESNSTPIQWQKIDFKDFIQDLTQSFEMSLASKNLTLVINVPSQPLPVHTDLDSLNRILTELFTNAEKYADYGSSIHLNAHCEFSPLENRLILTLNNVGSAISPEELPYIFDKFRRGQGVTQRAIQGTGLGLALAKGLVEHLDGTIAVSSRPLEQSQSWETCFTLTLPLVHGNSTYSDLDRTLI